MNREYFPVVGSPSSAPWHLLEEINHRVANEYGDAIALLAVAARRSETPEARETLSGAAQRLGAYAETHRALLPPLGTAPVNLCDYIGRFCAAMLKSSLAEAGVKMTLSSDEINLPPARCWRVALIVAELVSNAFRHGLSGGAGAIGIALTDGRRAISCVVCDDGHGPHNPVIGRGRRLIQTMAAELGGSVDWSFTQEGCTARLLIPSS